MIDRRLFLLSASLVLLPGLRPAFATTKEGATEHIVLPVSHLSMLWSGGVAEQVVSFLSSGRFRLSSRC